LIAEENPKVVGERAGRSAIVLTLGAYSLLSPPTMRQDARPTRLEKLLYGKDGAKTGAA
jgi:hypothetical protein